MFTRWAVARGARRLDGRNPGWEARIDVADLDLSDPCRCVVGQLYGTYAAGLRRLRLLTGLTYGFTALSPVEYACLQREWICVLAERLPAAPERPADPAPAASGPRLPRGEGRPARRPQDAPARERGAPATPARRGR
jgi:hypothetical protein